MNTNEFHQSSSARIWAELQKGPLAHAYLISGEDAEQRRALAEMMARSLICTATGKARPCETCASCVKAQRGIHPDVLVQRPAEGKTEIPVATVREMVRDAPTLPNEAPGKVYIVEEADCLNSSAQNAFLRLLEEPPSFVTFLLLAENPLALLPTVRSRCIHLGLAPEEREQGLSGAPTAEVQALVERFFRARTGGALDLLSFCVDLEKVERQTLFAFVAACHTELARALGQRRTTDRAALIKAVDLFDSLRLDLRFHVGGGHISGKILATLI